MYALSRPAPPPGAAAAEGMDAEAPASEDADAGALGTEGCEAGAPQGAASNDAPGPASLGPFTRAQARSWENPSVFGAFLRHTPMLYPDIEP